MAADALIFDLDGTIWDSAGWFAAGLSNGDTAVEARLRVELMEGGNIIGALARAGITRNRLLSESQARAGPPPLFDGMREALNSLSERGTRLAVATSLPGTLATPMLRMADLDGTFEIVVHAGLCRTPKPHPRSLYMVLERLGLSPSPDCYYVGDRASDQAAAAAAGLSAAWMAHGYEKPAKDMKKRTISPAELLGL